MHRLIAVPILHIIWWMLPFKSLDLSSKDSDKRADGSYAFERLSRYFDVIHRSFYAARLKSNAPNNF